MDLLKVCSVGPCSKAQGQVVLRWTTVHATRLLLYRVNRETGRQADRQTDGREEKSLIYVLILNACDLANRFVAAKKWICVKGHQLDGGGEHLCN